MDNLLASAQEQGHEPANYILREAEWAEIGERFKGDDTDRAVVNGDTYKGIAVHIGPLEDHEQAAIVTRGGERRLA
jgi:hypothetical protein